MALEQDLIRWAKALAEPRIADYGTPEQTSYGYTVEAAYNMLTKLGHDAIPYLIPHLKYTVSAINDLLVRNGVAAVVPVASVIGKGSYETRAARDVLERIAAQGDPAALEAIAALLTSESAEVRRVAGDVLLGSTGGVDVRRFVRPLMTHESPAIKDEVKSVLMALIAKKVF